MIPNLRNKTSFSNKCLILLVLTFAVLSIGVQSLEAGACEKAFINCTYELFAETSPFWFVYCVNGYAFCLKYIN